jgi:muramoyltetrapeptide carboxypeptidase
MNTARRNLLKTLGLATLAVAAPLQATGKSSRAVVKPSRLKEGDTVGIINPAGATFQSIDITMVCETLAALGLKCKPGKHVLDRYGYLGGKDEDRAADVNGMFADPDVHAIITVRGGWGCNRILPLLDYNLIRANPKALIGYSDITSLLVALYARSGLVSFHGPVGTSTWNAFSRDYFHRILFLGESVEMKNPVTIGDNLAQTKDRVETITSGKARGRLVGGNLSVLSAMLGSEYLPEWKDTILFIEETDEQIYRVDRMLTHLKIAGVLGRISGFVFGKCTNCGPGQGYGSLTLEEVLADHITPLRIPAWYGAMIGHITDKFTVPVGVEVEIDAAAGTIRMLEPAVV